MWGKLCVVAYMGFSLAVLVISTPTEDELMAKNASRYRELLAVCPSLNVDVGSVLLNPSPPHVASVVTRYGPRAGSTFYFIDKSYPHENHPCGFGAVLRSANGNVVKLNYPELAMWARFSTSYNQENG